MSRSISFAPGEFYHVYNRGIEKRNIFTCRADYERFQTLLYRCNDTAPVHLKYQGSTLVDLTDDIEKRTPFVEVGAYCLMPNHFHLLVQETQDGGVSRFLQKVTTGYTMYFNKRFERSGVLFQGKFKATHANKDAYLKYLISYIHLNPVKLIEPTWKESGIRNRRKAETYLDSYRYSSYLDYIGHERIEKYILNKNALPGYFLTHDDFKKNLTEWLAYTEVRPR